jgi:hypothetical protein
LEVVTEQAVTVATQHWRLLVRPIAEGVIQVSPNKSSAVGKERIMKTQCAILVFCTVLILTPLACLAQSDTKKAAASPGTRIMNKQVGIAFSVPNGIELYSADSPGPLPSRISADTPYFLVNPDFRDENVNIKIADGVSESDLNGLKQMLDSNPNTPLPGYKRIAVRFINVGKDGTLKAVEHQYQMKGNVLGTIRNITFVIGNRGFIITCGTAVERFEKANREFFEPFLKSIEPVK